MLEVRNENQLKWTKTYSEHNLYLNIYFKKYGTVWEWKMNKKLVPLMG